MKSPIFQKINSYMNNISYNNSNTTNFCINKVGKKSSEKINTNNLKKNNPKINLINVQFPKAKFLNIYTGYNNT